MSISPATQAPQTEHVLLHNISWSTYEALLADLAGGRRLKLTYDRGDLEIMSPQLKHESYKRLTGRMVEAMTEELEVPLKSRGATTWKSRLLEKGLEADECYWVQHEAQVRGSFEDDLEKVPPPDLALEADVTRSWLDRMAIYVALRIPEVWEIRGGKLNPYPSINVTHHSSGGTRMSRRQGTWCLSIRSSVFRARAHGSRDTCPGLLAEIGLPRFP